MLLPTEPLFAEASAVTQHDDRAWIPGVALEMYVVCWKFDHVSAKRYSRVHVRGSWGRSLPSPSPE